MNDTQASLLFNYLGIVGDYPVQIQIDERSVLSDPKFKLGHRAIEVDKCKMHIYTHSGVVCFCLHEMRDHIFIQILDQYGP